ncbi:MAG: hypothetical protein K1X53_07970 [Candidatus Sumerlaeaceae bacterium]|nr:hypothetical protein [Candidatus Sumerlaeaceae bacterium]
MGAKSVAEKLRVVLVRPEKPRNAGAVLRAAANFGAESVWVAGDTQWDAENLREVRVASSGAWDVVGGLRFVQTVAEAVKDCALVAGTTSRHRRNVPTPVSPREFMMSAGTHSGPTALLFGPESKGLAAADLALCHATIRISTRASFPSLNLAQAVTVVLYEAALVRGGADAKPNEKLASIGDQEEILAALEAAVNSTGSPLPRNRELVLAQLRRMLQRSEPTEGDISLLRNLGKRLKKR